MKHFFQLSLLTIAMTLSGNFGTTAQASSRAYGIQVYSESAENDNVHKLVSFPIDNPGDITVEEEFGDSKILAATAYNDTYYMLLTEDETVPSKFVAYDMKRHKLNDVKIYNYTYDVAGSLMVLDMTYDPLSERIYAVAADLGEGELVGEELNAPFGLYVFDPLTGDAQLIGYEETAMIIALAANEYDLWGVDSAGNVWIMNKNGGYPEDIIYSTGIAPIGIQSMAYDFGNGKFYWPSYTATPAQEGVSELVWFSINEDWDVESGKLGKVGEDIELIGFYIDDNALDIDAPRGVTDLNIVAADNGTNEAILSWINPEKTIGGNMLTDTITITIMRDDVKAGEVTGNPGESMVWTDTDANSALYSYVLTTKANGLTGTSVYAEPIFIGTDVPGAPIDVKAIRDAIGSYDITISWEAPEEGAQGGWFDKDNLHYNVTRYPDNKIIAENTSALSVVDSDITVQKGYTYGIKAITDDGFGAEALSNIIVSGPALQPPYAMTLTEEDENLWTVVNGDGDEYTWYVFHEMWGGTTDPFFRYYPEETLDPFAEAEDWIISPFIALEAGKKYVVAYDLRLYGEWFLADTSLWIGNDNAPEAMTRNLASYEQEMINVEWMTHTIPFTVDADGSFNFGFRIHNRVPAQLYQFTVHEVADIELETLSLNGPHALTLNQPFTYKTEVKNLGFSTVDNYTICLKDTEGHLLAEQSVEVPIAPGEISQVEIKWTPETAGEYYIYSEVVVEGDADSNNNISPELAVNVADEGTWIDVATANYNSGREPFFTRHNYSASQSIYSADMIKAEKGIELRGLTYYITDFMTKDPLDCDIEIWLANTSKEEFTDYIISENELTKVFDGKVTMSPEDDQVTIIFDTPFIYTGENLAVCTSHHSANIASIVFGAYRSKESPFYTVEYFSDEEAFNFTQEMLPAQELPALSLLVYDPESGILAPISQPISVSYDKGSRSISVDGDFKSCRIYTASGVLLAVVATEGKMEVPVSAEGIGIVEVLTGSGKIVKKIVF